MNDVVLYDDMCRAIAECRQVDEVKQIRDKAKALAEYLRQAKDRDQARKCDEIRIRAEIGAGRMLREQEESGEREGKGRPDKMSNGTTLSDLGVSRDQSSKWQKMSEAYEANPALAEDYLRHDEQPTTSGFLNKMTGPGGYDERYTEDALWLWGRMRDFRENLLTQDPWVVFDGMSDQMRDEFKEILPGVIAWLEKLR